MKLRKSRALLAACTALVLAIPLTSGAGAAPPDNDNGKGSTKTVDQSSAVVVLSSAPVSTATTVDRASNGRVKLTGTQTKSYRAQLSAERNAFRDWLKVNAPKARISGQFDISLNAVTVSLNGTSIDALRAYSKATSVQYAGFYHKTSAVAVDPDLAIVNAVEAWGGGGAAGAGLGVKVAIIDSGIDQDHACFDSLGDSDGANNFTNNKVIVAKVFSNKANQQTLTAEAIDTHGTHVAGTVACDYNTPATVDGVAIPHGISGVAPAAKLGNYNVFPGTLEDARSEDILNALDAAYADGMNVANMSLGSDAHGMQDLLTIAVDNLDKAGMVVAVSNGNEGPGFGTVDSPGSANGALTAGASTVSHLVTRRISFNGTSAFAAVGEFGAVTTMNPWGTLQYVDGAGPAGIPALAGLSEACAPGDVEAAVGANRIAVVARGTCDFTVKVANVTEKGYTGVIVVNREEQTLVMAGTNEGIPALFVPVSAHAPLKAADGLPVAITDPAYFNPYPLAEENQMGDFSSEGPTDVDRRIKPDLVAPGVNVLSSIPDGKFAFFNGTSMASPHLAGAAAVVLSQHPTWASWQVRSAITNTADMDALTPFYDNEQDDPNLIGAGLLDVQAAVNATALVSPVSTSFGTAQKGAGTNNARSVTVQNLTGGTLTAVVVGKHGAANFTVSGTVTAGATGAITVTATTAKRAAVGASWATVELRNAGGQTVAHFRVYVLIA